MSGSSQTVVHDALDALCREMAQQWQSGQFVPAEDYLKQLGQAPHAEDAVRLIYEEICLRQDRGEELDYSQWEARFPEYAEQLGVLLECHQLFRDRPSQPRFPAVGETLGDFRLIEELGRGAVGVVFLARQQTLSDRPVVLKLSPRKTREHLSLARLQHTHIVPIHAIYEYPGRHVLALCEPYLGGATLDRILEELRPVPVTQRTGQSILDVLDRQQHRDYAPDLNRQSDFRRMIAASTYPEAICLIGACLAEGLQYAHERELLHLDIKPSNVLLTAEAQPLLLDFHLAQKPMGEGEAAPEWFGGTPAFASPEQVAACEAARRGRGLPAAVGTAADIYSLGKVLYAALAGQTLLPDPIREPVNRLNAQVDVGLADIVQRCLQDQPGKRYARAGLLAADLRRHLAHQPLLGVGNRSLLERWRKWRRRRPQAALVAALLLALCSGVIVLLLLIMDRTRAASEALAHGKEQLQRGLFREAQYSFARGQEQISGLPWFTSLRSELSVQQRLAEKEQARVILHEGADKLRFLAGKSEWNTSELQSVDQQCRQLWEQRVALGQSGEILPAAVRHDLLDIALVWGQVQERLSPGNVEAALRTLDEAERLIGPTAALDRERAALRGQPVNEARLEEVTSATERLVIGLSLLRKGQPGAAIAWLEQVAQERPGEVWPSFYLGVARYQTREYAAAERWFSIAIALMPGSAELYYNRALARARLNQMEPALLDYSQAIAKRPGFGAAWLNRGDLHYQQKQFPQALDDFEHALENGASVDLAHYNLALTHLAKKDERQAVQHLEAALEARAEYREAKELLEQLRRRVRR